MERNLLHEPFHKGGLARARFSSNDNNLSRSYRLNQEFPIAFAFQKGKHAFFFIGYSKGDRLDVIKEALPEKVLQHDDVPGRLSDSDGNGIPFTCRREYNLYPFSSG